MTHRATLLIGILVSLGVWPRNAVPQILEVRDSAGIRIAESTFQPGAGLTEWKLSKSPQLSIGVRRGDPDYELYEVVAGMRLDDGRIVVGNAGSNELRFYDAAGRFIHAVGGNGGGPGEFRELGTLRKSIGDSLVALDPRSLRLSFFDSDGRFGRSANVDIPSPVLLGAFADGRLLLRRRKIFGPVEEGLHRDPVPYYIVGKNGEVLDTLGYYPEDESYVHWMPPAYSVMPAVFGRSTQATVFRDRFYVGLQESYEVKSYSEDGALQEIIRLDRANRRVTAEDIESSKEEHLKRASTQRWREQLHQIFRRIRFPEFMPAYGTLVTDDGGNIWIQDYRPSADEMTQWLVFDPAGGMLATAEMPAGLLVFEIGSDYVLGRWRDDMGVEYIHLYRLTRD